MGWGYVRCSNAVLVRGPLGSFGGLASLIGVALETDAHVKRALRKLVPNIPFQALVRGANGVGYTSYPYVVDT